MQHIAVETNFFLPELLKYESKHLNQQRLVVSQRFQLCIKALEAMQELVARKQQVSCLGLHGFVVSKRENAISRVSIGSFSYPTNKDAILLLADMYITATDSDVSHQHEQEKAVTKVNDVANEKRAVQLLGRLFLEIFRIQWSVNENDAQSQLLALMLNRQLPGSDCFQLGFRNCVDETRPQATRLDDMCAQKVAQLLIDMNQFDPTQRVSIDKALQRFKEIYESRQYVLSSRVDALSLNEKKIYKVLSNISSVQQIATVLLSETLTDIEADIAGSTGGTTHYHYTQTTRLFGAAHRSLDKSPAPSAAAAAATSLQHPPHHDHDHSHGHRHHRHHRHHK